MTADPIRRARGFVLGLLTLLSGCSSATVHLRDGPPIDGEIVDSDARTVRVRVDGRPVSIERAHIAEIDHPGNVAMLVGGVLMGISAAMITVPLVVPSGPECDDEIAELVLVSTGVMYGLTGVVPLVAGGLSWTTSRRRAAGRADDAASVHIRATPMGVRVRF